MSNLPANSNNQNSITSNKAKKKKSEVMLEDLSSKLTDLIERGHTQMLDPASRPMGGQALAGFMAHAVRLLEIQREIELEEDASAISNYEILSYATDELKAEFENVWMRILQNYADIKNISIEDVLK